MADDAAKVAAAYFEAWKVNDFDTMRSLVDDDVTFEGPLAKLEGVANWLHVEDGKITSLRVAFDAREFAP
jgi:hypothetical protein